MKANAIKNPVGLFLCFLALYVFHACGNSQEVSSGPFEIKPGTELIYGVESSGMEYDFIVKILSADKKGLSFEWAMTAPVNYKGKITITADALQNARVYNNYFKNNTDLTFTNESTVFLSKVVFDELKSKKGEATADFGRGPEVFGYMEGLGGEMEVNVKGKNVLIPFEYGLNLETENQFKFAQIGNYYLILEMWTDFHIFLKEVK